MKSLYLKKMQIKQDFNLNLQEKESLRLFKQSIQDLKITLKHKVFLKSRVI